MKQLNKSTRMEDLDTRRPIQVLLESIYSSINLTDVRRPTLEGLAYLQIRHYSNRTERAALHLR